MSIRIHSYLTFNGNCREAMTFYQKCFGGNLEFQTVGTSPLSGKMPGKMKDAILHASLSNGVLMLMGSDMTPESGLVKGNSVSLSVSCESEDELKRLYRELSSGGTEDHSLERTFYGALLGDLTDRFGYHWILTCQKVKKQYSKQDQQ